MIYTYFNGSGKHQFNIIALKRCRSENSDAHSLNIQRKKSNESKKNNTIFSTKSFEELKKKYINRIEQKRNGVEQKRQANIMKHKIVTMNKVMKFSLKIFKISNIFLTLFLGFYLADNSLNNSHMTKLIHRFTINNSEIILTSLFIAILGNLTLCSFIYLKSKNIHEASQETAYLINFIMLDKSNLLKDNRIKSLNTSLDL